MPIFTRRVKENSREDQETKKVKKFMKSTAIVKWDFLYEEIFLKKKKNKIEDVTYFLKYILGRILDISYFLDFFPFFSYFSPSRNCIQQYNSFPSTGIVSLCFYRQTHKEIHLKDIVFLNYLLCTIWFIVLNTLKFPK